MIIFSKSDFLKGSYENVLLKDDKLILEDKKTKGIYCSEVVEYDRFEEIVASWNGKTTKESNVELQVQIYCEDKWSEWFTYGKWSDKGLNKGSISNQKDDIAKMDIDIIKILAGKVCNKFRFKIILERESGIVESPNIRLVAFTFKFYNEQQNEKFSLEEIDINVPMRSQRIVPKIGGIICSPTSLSMVMEFFGVSEETEFVANGVKDNGVGIYGNWTYNVAYAGERGFKAYVKRCNSIEDVKNILLKGNPIVASIKTRSKDELDGSFCSHPAGHLLVIRGFTRKNEKDYIIVNDPAAPDNISVKNEYILSQFIKAWSNIVYVIE